MDDSVVSVSEIDLRSVRGGLFSSSFSSSKRDGKKKKSGDCCVNGEKNSVIHNNY